MSDRLAEIRARVEAVGAYPIAPSDSKDRVAWERYRDACHAWSVNLNLLESNARRDIPWLVGEVEMLRGERAALHRREDGAIRALSTVMGELTACRDENAALKA